MVKEARRLQEAVRGLTPLLIFSVGDAAKAAVMLPFAHSQRSNRFVSGLNTELRSVSFEEKHTLNQNDY
jgi:hypothetical protein